MGQAVVLYDFDGNNIGYDYPLFTSTKYRTDPICNVYMYRQDATPSLTSSTEIGDITLDVDSNTNVSNGDAITIYENDRVFQSLVVSSTESSITIGSQIDYVFTTNAVVEVGPWNAAVDGSITEQTFIIKPPPLSSLVIKSLSGSILDQSDMDDAKFGGISALTNGIIFRLENEETRQFALIVNNIGFYENGFDIDYASKAPAGYYGFRFRRILDLINGVVLQIHTDSEMKLIIRDNLTDLDQLAISFMGFLRNY